MELDRREVGRAGCREPGLELRPGPGRVLWDVGTGAGSIAIEWCRAGGDGDGAEPARAYALERDPDNADLAAEAERLYAEWDAASVVVTVEKRTSEWVDAFKAESIRTHKIKTGKGGQPLDDADTRRIVLHQLAEQIVSPQLTYDHLEGLYQVAEGEVSKLIVAMNLANNALPETAAVVTAGFSHGRSAAAQD